VVGGEGVGGGGVVGGGCGVGLLGVCTSSKREAWGCIGESHFMYPF